MTLISRFESLESLGIEVINLMTEVEPIDECLKLLANKCTKLRELRLRTTNSLIISDNIFFSLSEFRSLERLIFNSTLMGHLYGSVECLKHMTRLKHLSIDYSQLTEDFFANIQTLLPNVQSLDINIPNIGYNSIKSFVESLQSINRFNILKELSSMGRHSSIVPFSLGSACTQAYVVLGDRGCKVIYISLH